MFPKFATKIKKHCKAEQNVIEMGKMVNILLCHNCAASFPREMDYCSCSNCFACTGCEIYLCPECSTEIIVKPRKTGRMNPVDSLRYE